MLPLTSGIKISRIIAKRIRDDQEFFEPAIIRREAIGALSSAHSRSKGLLEHGNITEEVTDTELPNSWKLSNRVWKYKNAFSEGLVNGKLPSAPPAPPAPQAPHLCSLVTPTTSADIQA